MELLDPGLDLAQPSCGNHLGSEREHSLSLSLFMTLVFKQINKQFNNYINMLVITHIFLWFILKSSGHFTKLQKAPHSGNNLLWI